jgi:hypothetical protein
MYENITNNFVENTSIIKQNVNKIYEGFIIDKEILKKKKIKEIKEILRYYNLPLSGLKCVLIQRIENLFITIISSVKIQSIFRGYLLRFSIKLRGKGFINKSICINDTDFYSLEPLTEVPYEYFYTFNSGDFVYGCNIISLIHFIKSNLNMRNPYNRDSFSKEDIYKIIKLYSLIEIIHGLPEDAPTIRVKNRNMKKYTLSLLVIENIREKMMLMSSRTVNERINELFIEIDQLGNYTQQSWFSTLDRRNYFVLYRTLYEIWTFRGQLTREMKSSICVLQDPFYEVNRLRLNVHQADIHTLRLICLRVIENMVYCGIDDEYRKIGTLHFLTALTYVSPEARDAMPWLYETIF